MMYNATREVKKVERTRVNLWIPNTILEEVDAYQKKNGIPTRTAAILELLRKGLREEKQREGER